MDADCRFKTSPKVNVAGKASKLTSLTWMVGSVLRHLVYFSLRIKKSYPPAEKVIQ